MGKYRLGEGGMIGVLLMEDKGYSTFNRRIKLSDGKYVTEGLIMTHPIEKAINGLKQRYDLTDKDNIIDVIRTGKYVDIPYGGAIRKEDGDNDTEYILVLIKNDDELKHEIEKYLNVYGYFLSHDHLWSNGFLELTFEKKYDVDVTDYVYKMGVLYHLCRKDVLHKILRNGLTPRENEWYVYKNEPRIYFFCVEVSDERLEYWVQDTFYGKTKKTNEYVLLKIDVSKIKNNPKFYGDPRLTDAVYTHDNVNPEAIKVIKEIKYESKI